eukprot:9482523-Pyramimonas_sp.AAC.1
MRLVRRRGIFSFAACARLLHPPPPCDLSGRCARLVLAAPGGRQGAVGPAAARADGGPCAVHLPGGSPLQPHQGERGGAPNHSPNAPRATPPAPRRLQTFPEPDERFGSSRAGVGPSRGTCAMAVRCPVPRDWMTPLGPHWMRPLQTLP